VTSAPATRAAGTARRSRLAGRKNTDPPKGLSKMIARSMSEVCTPSPAGGDVKSCNHDRLSPSVHSKLAIRPLRRRDDGTEF
jgi:hypothetical protein